MPTDRNEFKIKFDGELHQVSANVLISSLIGVSTILQEANNEINRDTVVDIKIKALAEGSFEVHWIYAFVGTTVIPLMPSIITTGSDLLTILTGVLDLKKHLKGEKPGQVTEISGGVEISNTRGNVIVVNKPTYNLYQRVGVQDALSKTFSSLESDPMISSFEVLDESGGVLHKSQREDFGGMAQRDAVLEEGTRIITEIATLHIFKLVFDSRHKWEFYYKGNRISAFIADEAFFERVDSGEEFSKGDQLVVELEIEQTFDNTVNTYVNRSFRINNVREHIPRAQQESLELEW